MFWGLTVPELCPQGFMYSVLTITFRSLVQTRISNWTPTWHSDFGSTGVPHNRNLLATRRLVLMQVRRLGLQLSFQNLGRDSCFELESYVALRISSLMQVGQMWIPTFKAEGLEPTRIPNVGVDAGLKGDLNLHFWCLVRESPHNMNLIAIVLTQVRHIGLQLSIQ